MLYFGDKTQMKKAIEDAIESLAKKSKDAQKGIEAMQLSQAALNLANILAAVDNLKQR